MNIETQLIETIYERDVDLILLEELNTSIHFVIWLCEKLQLPECTELIGCWRSIFDTDLGETDLHLTYHSSGQVIFVLIENKVDAAFQEAQFERYQKRGEKYKLDSKCAEYHCILVAPKEYADAQVEFLKCITYEELRDYFKSLGDRRFDFKAGLLQIAIEKLKRGYQAVNCEPARRFMLFYWEYKADNLPEFQMKKPALVPIKSDWIQLRNPALKGIVFFHKLSKGFIDALFAEYAGINAEELSDKLPDGWSIVKHESGRFAIRQNSNPLDKLLDFDKQIADVRAGLEKVKKISDWIKTNL